MTADGPALRPLANAGAGVEGESWLVHGWPKERFALRMGLQIQSLWRP
jgi:hypothetical protein